jgi:hypothetical protein
MLALSTAFERLPVPVLVVGAAVGVEARLSRLFAAWRVIVTVAVADDGGWISLDLSMWMYVESVEEGQRDDGWHTEVC